MFNPHREIIIQRHRRRISKTNSSKSKSSLILNGNYLREFSSITSLHGIMYLGEPNRPLFERIFWLSVMSLVASLCGYLIFQLYNNWLSGRLIVTLDNNKHTISDFPFPAITFCSDLQLQNIHNRSLKDEVFNKETEDVINILCFQHESNKNVTLKYISSKNWQHVVENHKLGCQKIISKLYWIQDEIHSPCDYIQTIITKYGICYSLNMIPNHLLWKKNNHETMYFSNHSRANILTKNETFWTPETGFSRNATPFDLPWRVIGDTTDNAVRLIFNLIDTHFRGNCPNTDSGLTLLLHNPADLPIGIQPTAYVTRNNMLSISLTITLVRSSPKIKKWPSTIRNCYFQHERQLKFFKIYTNQNCEIECKANNTLNKCGCNAFYQPRDSEVAVCGSESFNCVRESSTIGYSVFDKEVKEYNTIADCKCLPACKDIVYHYEAVEFLRNWTINSTNFAKQNENTAVMVVIYFSRKSVVDIIKAPLMPFNELLGNIGGLFGLFLGCSIISFFEILYFFVIRLYFDRRERKKANSKVMPMFVHE